MTHFHASIYDQLNSTDPHDLIQGQTVDEFIKLLKQLHKRPVPSKVANRLLSPARFDSTKSTTARGRGSVLYAGGIWLDNDGGDLTHKDFAALFSSIRVVAFSTYSSTKAKPKFRIYIPSTDHISADDYRRIVDITINTLHQNGYKLGKKNPAKPSVKTHGFDLTKRNASDLFYLPCQSADLRGSFFKDYKKDRKVLDPTVWLATAPTPINSAPAPLSPASANQNNIDPAQQALIEAAVEDWRSKGVLPGEGDSGFFRLARELKAAGMDEFELEATLHREAQHATSPGDRVRQIPRIMESLRRYRRRA